MTDRCLDSHCEHPDHRDSKPPGAATDPLDTVPPEERERIVAVAQKAAEHAWRFAGDSAKEPEYCAAIAREVAAYHARTDVPRLTPAEEAEIIASAPGQIGPGQTPIGRPPSLIADAFAATLWLLAALLGESPAWTLTAIRALRPLIQRAAEEHARQNRYFVRAATSTLDGDDADDAARTSGPGPLAEDGALLRRCVAEIRALRKGRREAAQTLIAEIGAAGPEDIEQAAARAIAQIREQDAEIDRWKTAVVSKAAERDVAVTENGRLRSEVERLTAKLAGIEGVAAQGDGMMATIDRLTAELARPVPVAAAADRLAAGHVQRLRDGTWAWCHDGGFDNGVVALSPKVSAWLSDVVNAHRHTLNLTQAQSWVEQRYPSLAGYEKQCCVAIAVRASRGETGPEPASEEHAVDASRPATALDRETLGRIVREVWIEWAREQTAPKPSWLVPWEGLSEPDREVDRRIGERIAREALASRPGLTEEQAIGAVRAEMGSAWIDANPVMAGVVVGLLRRHSRGALAPGDVSVPRAILERLTKAADLTFSDAREARWAAERILQRADLAAEPARTDPEAARRLAGSKS